MSKQQIIAFAGKRGAGKTSAAMYLKEAYRYKKVSFADALKEKALLFFPFGPSDFTLKGKEKKFCDYPWTVREFLINLGSFARYHDEDYWIKASGLDNATGKIVIDDLRFLNEAAYLKKLGAKLIRINRYPKLNIYGPEVLDDPSETSLDDYKEFDYTIEDCVNTDLKSLYNQIEIALEAIGLD